MLNVFILIAIGLDAQISASVTEGCAPLASVAFTNSFPSPTGISWDFDDGASSNLSNPIHSFATAGTYDVVFTATSGGSPVTATITITVYANPIAGFSTVPELGVCQGATIQFNDNSTGGSGSAITSRQWDFGDGLGGVGASISHIYSTAGSYIATIIVIDGNNCTATAQASVAVSQPPTINLSTNPSPAAACAAPLTVSFTNTSSSNSPIGGGLTHSWNFGNGETSIDQVPPAVTYTAEGNYVITYTATDNIGCSASQNIPVSVQEPSASITVVGANNGVACSQIGIAVDGTEGGTFSHGDGTTGFSTTHTYGSSGTYDIVYNVNVSGCSAQATTSITIEIPVGEIVSDPGFACFKPAAFTYSVQSASTIDTYDWSFSNLGTSTDANPTALIDYGGPGEYDINGLITQFTLVNFTTVNGCTGSANIMDSLALPNALFYPDVTQGCAPLGVNFTDRSSYYLDDPGLVAWEWHYGDGTILMETESINPSHTYTDPGEYEAFLIVTTPEGCIDTSFVHLIEVGEPVDPSFTLSPATVCQGEPVQITNTSVNAALIDAYSYSGDMSTLSNCMDEPSPSFIFDDVVGLQDVTQFAEYNGCISSSTQQITVQGPIGKLNYECNCGTPLEYVFTAAVQGADHWTWDFGDGTVIENSMDDLMAHTFSESGDFEVVLTSFSETTGCAAYTDTAFVKVRQLDAAFVVNPLACAGELLSLNAANSTDVGDSNDGCKRNYLWYFGDNTRPVKTVSPGTPHAYTGGGDFTIQLFVEDDNGCVDSTTSVVSVFGVTAAYEADTLTGCPPIEVNFTDLSISDTTLTSWSWNFDDGNTSSEQNPANLFENIQYNAANNPVPFTVRLQVTDILGCTDIIENLVINPLRRTQHLSPPPKRISA